MSYSYTSTLTFTATHAKYLASKITTDLKRIQRFYSSPTDAEINEYECELIELLKIRAIDWVVYGFQKNGAWIIPSLRYTAAELYAESSVNDDPGRIASGSDVTGAYFTSVLGYSSSWISLSDTERERVKGLLPFERVTVPNPGSVGSFQADRFYAAGSVGISRSSLQ